MEQRISLVFSWDPRVRNWIRERGQEDAAIPPAAPIDDEAVQTYFLDPQTGRWTSTILGERGRRISVELGDGYRSAFAVGLAIKPKATSGPGVPTKAWVAGVLAILAAAYLAQAPSFPMFQ